MRKWYVTEKVNGQKVSKKSYDTMEEAVIYTSKRMDETFGDESVTFYIGTIDND